MIRGNSLLNFSPEKINVDIVNNVVAVDVRQWKILVINSEWNAQGREVNIDKYLYCFFRHVFDMCNVR